MNWKVVIHHKIRRRLRRFPKQDTEQLQRALDQLAADPYSGDIEKMEGEENIWRRRVGAYRIFYELIFKTKILYVFRLERRTSKTY